MRTLFIKANVELFTPTRSMRGGSAMTLLAASTRRFCGSTLSNVGCGGAETFKSAPDRKSTIGTMNQVIRHRDGWRPIVNKQVTPVRRMIKMVCIRPAVSGHTIMYQGTASDMWCCIRLTGIAVHCAPNIASRSSVHANKPDAGMQACRRPLGRVTRQQANMGRNCIGQSYREQRPRSVYLSSWTAAAQRLTGSQWTPGSGPAGCWRRPGPAEGRHGTI